MKEEEKNIKLPFYGIPRLFPYIKPYRGRMVVMVLLGAATSAIDAAYPLFNRYALDHFIGEQTLNGIVIFIMAYIALLIGQEEDALPRSCRIEAVHRIPHGGHALVDLVNEEAVRDNERNQR